MGVFLCMLIECWKPRFRSAVEGFKKACREKRFAAMNLRKNDTRILGKAFLEKNPQTGSPRSEILSSARMVCSSSQESWEVWAPEAGSSLTTSGYVKLEQQRKNVEESVKRCLLEDQVTQVSTLCIFQIRYSCWSSLQWHPARQRDLVNGLYQAS